VQWVFGLACGPTRDPSTRPGQAPGAPTSPHERPLPLSLSHFRFQRINFISPLFHLSSTSFVLGVIRWTVVPIVEPRGELPPPLPLSSPASSLPRVPSPWPHVALPGRALPRPRPPRSPARAPSLAACPRPRAPWSHAVSRLGAHPLATRRLPTASPSPGRARRLPAARPWRPPPLRARSLVPARVALACNV
jgi:hypothetical protein